MSGRLVVMCILNRFFFLHRTVVQFVLFYFTFSVISIVGYLINARKQYDLKSFYSFCKNKSMNQGRDLVDRRYHSLCCKLYEMMLSK